MEQYNKVTPLRNITLSEFFDDKYLPFARATKRRSNFDYYVFNKHTRPVLGSKNISEITSEDIDFWLLAQMEKGYKPATVNKHSSMLNRVFNIAVSWNYLEFNVFKRTTVKKLPTGDFVQRFLDQGEIRRLLSACSKSSHPYLFYFVKLLLLTGARKSEVRLAKWKDIDFDKKELFVAISKNGRSRKVMLNDEAIEVLELIKQNNDAVGLPIRKDDWIFVNPKTLKAYTSFHLAFVAARESVGLETVRIHDLRHTFASLLINNGASIYEVQKLLGHHHISMTERYAHLFPNTLHDRVEIVGKMLKSF